VKLRLVLCIALIASTPIASAHAASPAKALPEAAPAASDTVKKGEWTAADYKAVRDRDEARQRAWDQKMKAVAGSICSGC
jgi:hypothetical protein